MIVIGGFYSLIHIIIIVVNKTTKFIKMHKILSYVIIRIIVLLILFSVYSLASSAMEGSPNFSFCAKFFNQCKPTEQPINKNKIILRIDDIQAFIWTDVQKQMIKDSIKRDIPPVLGVIPFGIENDKEIYGFLQKKNCNLEIAQHGWDHSMNTFGLAPEFSDLTREEAYERVMRGKPILERLAGKEVVTFIPPNNSFSHGSKMALADAGFKIISAEGSGQYDFSASTYDWGKGELNSVEKVLSACKEGLAKNNLCVIMTHPQDYAKNGILNKAKYGMFLVLLDKLIELDAMFVKASDLLSLENKENKFNELPDSRHTVLK